MKIKNLTNKKVEQKIRELLEEYDSLNDLSVVVALERNKISIAYWKEDEYGDEIDFSKELTADEIEELKAKLDNDDELDAFLSDIVFVDLEARGQEYYEAAQEAIEEHFGCTGAFLEPSTQCGQGGVFLFADDMSFTGHFDFETGEELIGSGDKEGFIALALNSFTVDTED